MRSDSDEVRGTAPSPVELRHRRVFDGAPPASSTEVDLALHTMLRQFRYSPEELFGAAAPTPERQRERDTAEAAMRHVLADAFAQPTPANFEVVGRCAMRLVHLAMDETARDFIERCP